MSYWLNIYKPQGISSAKAVTMVKNALQGPKIGHCGTLDVEAEGVLPLAIGEATKLVGRLFDAKKQYIFTMRFGAKTDSADFSGKIIATNDYLPSRLQVAAVCQKFIGSITQIPPAFSALKVAGIRSYALARQNAAVILPARCVEIYYLECLDFSPAEKSATYLVECSKGTYIRTLAEDIALSLQSLAFVIKLSRTQVGLFKAENAIHLSQIAELAPEVMRTFLELKSTKIEAVLAGVPVLDANLEQAINIRCGVKSCFTPNDQELDLVWVRYQGTLLAIGSLAGGSFKSSRVFNMVKI